MRFDSGITYDSGASYDDGKGGPRMTFKLLSDFTRYSEPNFLTKGRLIYTSLNTPLSLLNYPDPIPAPFPTRVALLAGLTAYEGAYAAAAGGDRALITARNIARQAFADLLKNIAAYLEVVARVANDITFLEHTGFDLRPEPAVPSGDPLPAPDVKLSRGILPGVIVAHATNLNSTYEVQTATGDPSVEANWHAYSIATSSSHIEISGLTPGVLYHVRIRGIAHNVIGAWSDVASLMAA